MNAINSKKQYMYIHILRIIAAFCVIFNHSADFGFYLYTYYPTSSIHFWVYLFFSMFSKVSVPLFFLISGALLLDKSDESLIDLFTKRIIKILIPLVSTSLVYYFYSLYWSNGPFNLREFLTILYSSDLMYHLWYMYAYLAYLICLPFLRSLVKSLSNVYFYYMIALALLFDGILPCVEFRFSQGMIGINSYLKPTWLLTNTVLYPCIGYFLQHRITWNLTKKQLLSIWGINCIGFIISCYLTYYRANLIGTIPKIETFHSCFVILNCIALYCSAKYMFCDVKLTSFPWKFIRSIADCTFGIYLIHLLFKDRPFLVNMVHNLRANGINYLLSSVIYCTCIFVTSYLITFTLSKIPVLRKTVGF